jgi:hypothetical protein
MAVTFLMAVTSVRSDTDSRTQSHDQPEADRVELHDENLDAPGDEHGFVTAEAAVTLPVLGLVLVACLAGAGVVHRELQIQDAARMAARSAARGDSDDVVLRAARQFAPSGATVRVWHDGELIRVEVVADAALPGPFGRWAPSVPLTATAAALDEALLSQAAP